MTFSTATSFITLEHEAFHRIPGLEADLFIAENFVDEDPRLMPAHITAVVDAADPE